MPSLLRITLLTALAALVSACAAAPPPPPPPDLSPPGSRRLDAKTQLETGRRY